jgi:hypothetical protein
MLNANITEHATTTVRVNVTLGHGKAVHAGTALTVKGTKYAASPDCGGNRATERYYETNQPVTCRRCLKALAARAEMLAAAEAEAYAEAAERSVVVPNDCGCPNDVSKIREFCSDNCKHIRPHGTGRSRYERAARQQATGRMAVAQPPRTFEPQPVRELTQQEATKLVRDFDQSPAAAALRGLFGQVASAVEEAVAGALDAKTDLRPAGSPAQFWSGDLLWTAAYDGAPWTTEHFGTWTLTAYHGDQGRHGWYLDGPGCDGAVRVGHLLSKSAMEAEQLIGWQTA